MSSPLDARAPLNPVPQPPRNEQQLTYGVTPRKEIGGLREVLKVEGGWGVRGEFWGPGRV